MVEILLANREQRCAEQFLTCLQTGYGGLSLGDSRSGGNPGGAQTRFRAVGRRRGD